MSWIFILPPLVCGLRAEGSVQSNHCEEKRRRVRLSGITIHLRRLLSRQIAALYTLNAASDGVLSVTTHDGLCDKRSGRDPSSWVCQLDRTAIREIWNARSSWREMCLYPA
jgi:hypothetical protein